MKIEDYVSDRVFDGVRYMPRDWGKAHNRRLRLLFAQRLEARRVAQEGSAGFDPAESGSTPEPASIVPRGTESPSSTG